MPRAYVGFVDEVSLNFLIVDASGPALQTGTSQRDWRIERKSRPLDPTSFLGVSMLHVMHDNGDGRLLVRFEGSLDERATDSVLSAVALTPVAVPVMLDLSRTTSIIDCALARLSEVLKARDVRFRGLRLYHERLLESVHLAERVPA